MTEPFSIQFDFEGRTFRFTHANPNDMLIQVMAASKSFYEIELLEALRGYISPGDLVLDIGANIGSHSVFFAAVCGAKVMSFEPNPTSFALLERNIAQNGLEDRVTPSRIALGDAAGKAGISDTSSNNLGMAKVVTEPDGTGEVEVARLDSLDLPGAPRLIKIDVEGMEPAVLAGAGRILAEHRPILSVEAGKRVDLERVQRVLRPLGYHVIEAFNYTATHIFVPALREEAMHEGVEIASRIAANIQFLKMDNDAAANRVISFVRLAGKQVEAAIAAAEGRSRNHLSSEVVKDLSGTTRSIVEELGETIAAGQERMARDWLAQLNAEISRIEASLTVATRTMADDLAAPVDEMERAVRQGVKDAVDPAVAYLRGALETLSGQVVALAARAERQRARYGDGADPFAQTLDAADLAWLSGRAAQFEAELSRALADDAGPETPAAPPAVPAAICFYDRDFAEGWGGWQPDRAVRLGAGGEVRFAQAEALSGLRSGALETPGAGIYRLRVRARFGALGNECPKVRVLAAGTPEELVADAHIDGPDLVIHFHQPRRVDAVEIRLIVERPWAGMTFTAVGVSLSRVDCEQHQAWVRRRVGAPVIASMASIPSRRAMLHDAVHALLPQCDEVRVFLNNYDDVPDFLDHPRVTYRRSQDHDDNGDAGKFGWIEDDDPPGYRIICDDDLLFPCDLVERLVDRVRATGDKAMVGLHGIMLRQPIRRYYEASGRSVVHFQARLEAPKQVQVLATCVMCSHSDNLRMRKGDFMARNMADVWLTKHAQDHGIPLVLIDRPWKWVRENRQAERYETIYESSLQRTRSPFDSSAMQDMVLKMLSPISLCRLDRPLAVMVIAAETAEDFSAFLDDFRRTRSAGFEWILVAACADASSPLHDHLRSFEFNEELHVVCPEPGGETPLAEMLHRLLTRLQFDHGFLADARLSLANPDWCAPDVLAAVDADMVGVTVEGRRIYPISDPGQAPDFALFSREALVRGLPLTAGASPLVANRLSAALRRRRPGAATLSMPWAGPAAASVAPAAGTTINAVFDRVVVLNLDRRPDRWAAISAELARHGIEAVRHRAVDGCWKEVNAAFRAYAVTPLATTGPGIPPIRTNHGFFHDAISENQRAAYLEQGAGRKAIATAGAMAYLKGMIQVLETAIDDGVESLLMLDDDVRLHNDVAALFSRAMTQLPDDWLILQLGSLQYDWDERWISWHSENLYRQKGHSVGSHAVGLRREIMPFLLEQSRRMLMPYDIGALSACTRAFPERNFVIHPNLAIQSVDDSDIGSSAYQKRRDAQAIHETYRWEAQDYGATPPPPLKEDRA